MLSMMHTGERAWQVWQQPVGTPVKGTVLVILIQVLCILGCLAGVLLLF